jgi:hypothetical protein
VLADGRFKYTLRLPRKPLPSFDDRRLPGRHQPSYANALTRPTSLVNILLEMGRCAEAERYLAQLTVLRCGRDA